MAGIIDFLNEEETLQPVNAFGSPAFVFLIDAGRKMFEVELNLSDKPFVLSLKCIRQWIRNYIFNLTPCYCSIVLFATDKHKNSIDAAYVYIKMDLHLVGAETIKTIDNLLKTAEEDQFENEYGFGKFFLPEVLWVASTILDQSKRKLKKNMILFTNEMNPFQRDRDDVRVLAKMDDLKKLKVNFQLVPFGSSFDFKLYKEMIDIGEGFNKAYLPVTTLEEIESVCEVPTSTHLPMANIMFFISDDFYIPVNAQNLTRPIKLPKDVEPKEGQSLSSSSRVVYPSTNDDLMNTNESYFNNETFISYQVEEIGGKKIKFSKGEMDEMNAIGERRLRLLGFKPQYTLSLELHLQPSSVIYPCERTAEGATAFFTALMKRCIEKKVVAICTFCPRTTSIVRYVALRPQEENGKIKTLMIYLPFKEEVRDVPGCFLRESATQEQTELMSKVVKKLKARYNPTNFPHPSLSAYWAAVEALALELKEQPKAPVDCAMPDYGRIHDKLQDIASVINSGAIYSSEYVVPEKIPKKKSDPNENLLDMAVVEEHYKQDTLEKLRVDQLKSFLCNVGKKAGMSKLKKADLIEKIVEHLDH